jgi:Zn-dependent protease
MLIQEQHSAIPRSLGLLVDLEVAMNASIKLGKIFGIPIGLHYSWFLIFVLITFSLGTGYFAQQYPQLAGNINLVLALVTSLLFFSSVVLHALRNHIPVKGITLFIFGGVAQIAREPETPGAEFRIAIAGPLVSFILAGLFGVLYLFGQQIPVLAAPSKYLMEINFILGLFNLVPGFPLDGGRVLRSIVWKLTSNYQRSTRFASISGQAVAFGFIALGVISMFRGQVANGLWLVFIGWFLQGAAASAVTQVNFQEKLRGLTVGQAMSHDYSEVPGLMTLNQIVQERVLTSGQHNFFVVDYATGEPCGMLTLQEITAIPQLKWRFITAQDTMKPMNRLASVAPETELVEAMQMMDQDHLVQIPVITRDRLVGLISRENVLRVLRLRSELGIS